MSRFWFLLVSINLLFISNTSFSQEDIFPNKDSKVFQFQNKKIAKIDSLFNDGESEKAQKLIYEYQKEPIQSYQDSVEYIYSLYMQYNVHYGQKNLQKAIPFLQKADQLIKDWGISHNILEAQYYHLVAELYYGLDFSVLDKSINAIDSAQIIYERGPYQGRTLYSNIVKVKYQAYSYSAKSGSIDTVFKYLDIQKVIFEKYNNLIPNFSENNLNLLLSFYATAYSNSGDYNKSISYNLEILRRHKGKEALYAQTYKETLFSLSIGYYYNNQHQNSISNGQKVINLELKDTPADDFDMIQYYNIMGINYIGLNEYDSALFWLKKCEDILAKHPDQTQVLAGILINIGSSNSKKGNFETAQRYLERAISLNKKTYGARHPTNAQAYRFLYEHYQTTKDQMKALYYVDSALQVLEPSHTKGILSSPKLESQIVADQTLEVLRQQMAQFMVVYKDDTTQYQYLDATVQRAEVIQKILDDKRRLGNGSETVLVQSEKFKTSYEAVIDALYRLYEKSGDSKYIEQAIGYISSSKSRSLVSEMGEFKLVNSQNIPESIRAEFITSKKKVESLNNLLNDLLQRDIDSDSIQILNGQKLQWSDRFTTVKETLVKDYQSVDPLLSPSLDLTEILSFYNTQKDDEIIIEYFMGVGYIVAVSVSQSKKSIVRLRRTDIFNKHLSSFLEQTNSVKEVSPAQVSKYKESAHYLYKRLLLPILEQQEAGINKITIIPDELLNLIPFELLITKNTDSQKSFKDLDYLIKDFVISYQLSSSNMKEDSVSASGKGILGFAYKGEGISDERANLGGLPGALEEVDYLKENFKGSYYSGKSGSKQQFLKEIGDYDVIHLALHGKADLNNRFNSSIIFNGDNDYSLNSYDLYGVKLNTKLVVLSACESGIGKLSKSEGSFSVARGFASVGVPSIVTTLWKVNDRASASIVKSFYDNLKQGDDKDEALQKAKLSFLESSDNIFSHPYYWGSYIVIGDVAPIDLEAASNTPISIIILAFTLLFLLAVVMIRRKAKTV